MSGPRDTRESAESAPPSFGGAVPPAHDPPPADEAAPAGEAAPTRPRLPAFGLQAPWWAAESTETAPPPEDAPPADPSDGDPAPEAPAAGEPAGEAANEGIVFGTETLEDAPAGPETTSIQVGTLVAGVGVPNVDSRRAVPAEPIVKRAPAPGDTDPDGFPAVPPDDGPPEGDAPEAAEIPPLDRTEDDETAVESTAYDRPAGDAPSTPAEAAYAAQATAFERAKEAENASTATLGQVLEPDAILPVGVTPPTGSGPSPGTAGAAGVDEAAPTVEQVAVIAPVYHAEGAAPIDGSPPPGPPPQAASKGDDSSNRRPLLIGGLAAVILAAAVALFAVGGGGGTESDGAQSGNVKAPENPAAAEPAPPAAPSPTTGGPPSRIDNERTDPKPIAFREVFPTEAIKLGGRTFSRDRWSLNRDPSYAARGTMLQTLRQEKCRKIVRATFIHRASSLAVTSGLAVMPTKEAALKVSQAGDPANYEWFRGMGGKHTPNLDRAGGYAAATVRGRYVAYAYVQWANGKEALPGDPVIKQAAQQFLDYDLRPITARAKN